MAQGKQKNKQQQPVKKQPVQKQPAQNSGVPSWVWLPAILLLTFIVFYPSLNNALTNWDDPRYLNDNPLIRKLDWEHIKRIFTEIYFGNYQPLHILSYAIEYNFYKLDPSGYHTTSVIMHLICTWLVYRFVLILTGRKPVALITALLFGIHPLHVESVAWAAERKDLLYAMFFLGSLICYVRFIKKGAKIKFFIFSFLLFGLSILSKAMAASLPPVLILLDIFYKRKFTPLLVLEKVPFFALAIFMGYVAASTVSETGQVSLNVFTLPERILIACFNLVTYIWKLILPVNLSAFYPYPPRSAGSLPWYFYTGPVIVAGVLFFVIRSLRKTNIIFFSAGFFVVCIILVLQLFPVGPTIISERYSYLPSVGFFFLIAWYFIEVIRKKSSFRTPLIAGLAAYSLFLCVQTFQRNEVWKDSMTLWTDVLDQFPHVGTALNNRGNIYGKERGDLDRAMEDFNMSIRYDPMYENSYANRGIVYCMRGKPELGIQDFTKAIELHPGYFDALYNRALTYSQLGKLDSAITDFNEIEKTTPGDKRVYLNRGWAYLSAGRTEEAMADFNRAIATDPGYADAYYRRANLFYNQKRYAQALADVNRAAELGFAVEPKYLETIKQAAQTNTP